MEGHNQNLSSNDSIPTPGSKSGELVKWVRPLQQALTVEVDHGCNNIQGRTNKFSSFVSGYLLNFPSIVVPEYVLSKLKKLALDYEKYPSLSIDDRRRIIVKTRQTLHNLYTYQENKEKTEPKKLKIRSVYDSVRITKSSSTELLNLSSSISAVKGVGPKQAERLSRLSLFLIF